MPISFPSTPLPYDPEALPRELRRHYLSASEDDLSAMLSALGKSRLADLYADIDPATTFGDSIPVPAELSYEGVQERMEGLAARNQVRLSFLGDGLPGASVHPVVDPVAAVRGLTTTYTPYQPERAQGTLLAHWIYQCLMARLTGFEAINSSLYDRASALYEACCVAVRLARKADTILIPEALYPGDLEVVHTLAADAGIRIVTQPLDAATGRIDPEALRTAANDLGKHLAAIVFPQVNTLGLLEDVDALTDLCAELGTRSIAVVDPLHIVTGGLKPPVDFGAQGANILVGEAQHLAIGPNFGGPGLGLFGVRLNDEVRNDIRATPGRYVGKGHDLTGEECRVMVLSTREQHIRRDKATSNICSNQAFLATLAGAATLARGDAGLSATGTAGHEHARAAVRQLTALPGVALAWPEAPFWNEVTLELDRSVGEVISAARARADLHLGVDVSARIAGGRQLLKISFNDTHDADARERLGAFFRETFGEPAGEAPATPELPASARRAAPAGLPHVPTDEVAAYYEKLGALNISPDDGVYPLGSCTMKYNPYLNDWAANLPGFTHTHPQAPIEDVQGNLEVIYETQEWFKGITGLAAVTTQPVAGAQGELVGIKLFQAWFRHRGETNRDVIFVPKTAHGTNFATAVMAGFTSKTVDGKKVGIVLLDADETGRIDLAELDAKLAEYEGRVAGIMITNPNTSGILESAFRAVADRIHEAGGLVYMDGANMNAIAGWVDLGALGVDAVHNNTHKTWTIPHGGGGPGDAFVAVSEKLAAFLPGYQVVKEGDTFRPVKPKHSIGSFHRHWGNFAHKLRCYAYLLRLGGEGVRRMSAVAVLSARYLHQRLGKSAPSLPAGATGVDRMHEFILTLRKEDLEGLEAAGVPAAVASARLGKLFLDFGFHAPTVAWPEPMGIMIEPTESFSKAELDRFAEAVEAIFKLAREEPGLVAGAPHLTPIARVDEVAANRQLQVREDLQGLPPLPTARVPLATLQGEAIPALIERIREAAQEPTPA